MSLNKLFIDFNSYFASVEQQEKPWLRNKPVGVVPVMADTTCCIAASYEAKRLGVKTGTMVSDAKKICPGIQLVEANHRTYIEYHHKITAAIEKCLPIDDKAVSIDEMVCSLIGKESQRDNAIEIAHRIKKRIRDDVGEYVRCSIGIAPNQFLAKTATDMQKPDGLVIIDNDDLPHCLYKLKINDFCGVGRRMVVRLRRNGIYTAEDLCKADRSLLHRVWGGIEGDRMYEQLRGKNIIRPVTHRSSIGHSHILPPKLKNNESAYAVLHRLLQKAAMRLRNLGYYAGALAVGVSYKNTASDLYGSTAFSKSHWYDDKTYITAYRHSKKTRWKDHITFTYTQNTIELIKAYNIMWERNPFIKNTPTAVWVVLFNLLHEKYATLPAFENYEHNKSLYSSIDLLNKRYGHTTVYFGGSHVAKFSAPMRIAFTQIPNLEIEGD